MHPNKVAGKPQFESRGPTLDVMKSSYEKNVLGLFHDNPERCSSAQQRDWRCQNLTELYLAGKGQPSFAVQQMTICEFFRPMPNSSRDDVFQTAFWHWSHGNLSFDILRERAL